MIPDISKTDTKDILWMGAPLHEYPKEALIDIIKKLLLKEQKTQLTHHKDIETIAMIGRS